MTSTLPKRPVSDYIHYCADAREQIKKANPDMKTKDIVIQMGANWKQLSPEEKEKYSAKAKLDKERYTQEMDSWTKNNPGVVIEKKVKTKKTKKTQDAPVEEEEEIIILEEELAQPTPPAVEKPKKGSKKKAESVAAPPPPPTPEPAVVVPPVEKKVSKYQNFLKVQRPLLKETKPELKPKEVLTELGAMWNKLSLEEKEKY